MPTPIVDPGGGGPTPETKWIWLAGLIVAGLFNVAAAFLGGGLSVRIWEDWFRPDRGGSTGADRMSSAPDLRPAPPPGPSPRRAEGRLGLGQSCDQLDPTGDVGRLLRSLGELALMSGDPMRSTRKATLRSSVGGGVVGELSPNARVRVVCQVAPLFVLIVQEEGGRGGVVDLEALVPTP
jgi:hypothetical protein